MSLSSYKTSKYSWAPSLMHSVDDFVPAMDEIKETLEPARTYTVICSHILLVPVMKVKEMFVTW